MFIVWKQVLYGIISGVYYLHQKRSILHNDLKEDNILLEVENEQMKAIIIDFGKSCFDGNGKKYSLSHEDIKLYKVKHPQIATDLRDGLSTQDKCSDAYSFGRVLLILFEKVLPIPALGAFSTRMHEVHCC